MRTFGFPLTHGYGFNLNNPIPGTLETVSVPVVTTEISGDTAAAGIEPGYIVRRVAPTGHVKNGFTVVRTPTAPGQSFWGVVPYVPGLVTEPGFPSYGATDSVPVVRSGYVWLVVENAPAIPSTAADTWYVRDGAGAGGGAGETGRLRYGNDDSGTCDGLPTGILFPDVSIAGAGGTALVRFRVQF